MKKEVTILIGLMLLLVSFFAAQEQLTGRATYGCTDTDEGLEYDVQGTVTVDNEKLVDACQQDTLIEYYCGQNQARIKVYVCPEGCQEGVCKNAQDRESREVLRLGTATNQIEINEYLGDVIDTLTDTRTPSLGSTTISTGKSTTLANQYLRFKDTDMLSGRILFTEDSHNDVDDFLVFKEENVTFEYELEFSPGLASAIESSQLEDLENEEVMMLGRRYSITKAEKNGNKIALRLLSGALQDTLREGEAKKYTLDGKEYVVKVMFIDDTARTATVSINNIISGQQSVGDVETLAGMMFGITKMYVSEAAEQDDQVTFVLDAMSIEFVDNNVEDDVFTQGVQIDGKSLANTYTKIKGSGGADEYTIISLKYRLKAQGQSDADVYIPAGKGLREMIRYPQALLGDWDIRYNGLDAAQTIVKFDPSGNKYDLEFSNVKRQRMQTTIVANAGGNLKIGDDDTVLHFIEGTSESNYIIALQDELVLTSDNDRNGITNILKYSSIDISNKVLVFDNLAEERKETSYTGTEGIDARADLVVSGSTYSVYIGGAPEYKLAVDLNHDGDVNSDEVNIVIEGGGLIDLGTTITPNNDFSITLTTQARQFDTPSNDEVITINIIKSGSTVDLDLPTQTALTIESRSGKDLAMSNYGVFLKQEMENPDELFIQYPLSQATGNIELVFRQQEQRDTIKTPEKKDEKKKTEVLRQTEPEKQEKSREEPKVYYEEHPGRAGSWLKSIWNAIQAWFL